jgi:putative MFS transporter
MSAAPSPSAPVPPAPVPEKEMSTLRAILHPAVIVGALGYFVDIYDLTLFSIVRVASLKDLGFAGEELVSHGLALLNIQMIGMLLGGIAFGVLGDRVGRVALLFSSILLYSVANIANGMVDTFGAYAFWRFVAGFGLAGELGGCITLVSEVLPKSKRGFGTAVVAGVGVMGAVFGEWVSRNVSTWGIFPDDVASWRICFYIGGVMGLALLALRVGVVESGLFKTLKQAGEGGGGRVHAVKRGDFFALFSDGKRFLRFARCILIGVPSWFVVGVLATLAPEMGRALQLTGEVTAGKAVSFVYLGLTLGDFASGFLSQWFGTRKKIVLAFVLITAAAAGGYLLSHGQSPTWFYTVCFALGVGIGYWAVFATIAAEHFGTNLRATVATTVPNFVRASIVPITFTFQWLKPLPGVGPLWAAAIVGALSIGVALWALRGLEETHGKDLDYLET